MITEIKGPDGKAVGRIVTEKTYIVEKTKAHFMRKYQGFGISQSIIDGLALAGVKTVRINYHRGTDETGETGKTKVYEAELSQFVFSEKLWNNLGNDLQRFVSLKDMREVKEQ